MNSLREAAYQIDPVLWVREVLGIEPTPWQQDFLRAGRGASILVLTARQIGKTTVAAWAIAHHMLFTPGGLSVVACPAQTQSAEAVRRVREILVRVGAEPYTLSRWEGVTRFIDDGRIELDNNTVERSIRPIALNRKNALFAGSDAGAEHWATIASLIETCKLNHVDPLGYLRRKINSTNDYDYSSSLLLEQELGENGVLTRQSSLSTKIPTIRQRLGRAAVSSHDG